MPGSFLEIDVGGGVAFNEHFSSEGVWKDCRLMRRPPETDARRPSVPRLMSGAHDAFNSRMAGKGPRLEWRS